MAICCVSLILALLDKGLQTRRWGKNIVASQRHEVQNLHTSNGASRCGVRPSTPHSSGLREPPQGRDFAKLNLHLPACRSLGAGRALFEQPRKEDFFSS
jgi:hypothetical protein